MPRLLLAAVVIGGPKKQIPSPSGHRACTQRGEDVQSGACIDPYEGRFFGGRGRVARGAFRGCCCWPCWPRPQRETKGEGNGTQIGGLVDASDNRALSGREIIYIVVLAVLPVYVLLSVPRAKAPPRVDAQPASRTWRRKR